MRSLVRYGLDGKFHASASPCIFRRTLLYLVDTSIKQALAGVYWVSFWVLNVRIRWGILNQSSSTAKQRPV